MDLINIVTTDLTAITRGRGVPLDALKEHAATGCGWVPANSALTPQDVIADPNPWGSHGDLRLVPDLQSCVSVRSCDSTEPDLHFVHGNLLTLDGRYWDVCPRTLLVRELEYYSKTLGWQVYSAFEHEFTLSGLEGMAPSFSLQAQRAAGPFLSKLADALADSGNEPETLLPEYGCHQYEVTCRPTFGLTSADRAVNLREIVRDVARQLGLKASFTPQPSPGSVSNGVHLHLSFIDAEGQPVLPNRDNSEGLSSLGRHWDAGVLHFMPALCALTAPSPVSYLRLKPHHWSTAYACLGVRNREAALRICPTTTLSNNSHERQFNLEFRALDATANPHLAMAAILKAGRLGIEHQLELKACVDQDPDLLDSGQREALGIHALPDSITEALTSLDSATALVNTLPEALLETYRALKRQELDNVSELDNDTLCRHYAEIY